MPIAAVRLSEGDKFKMTRGFLPELLDLAIRLQETAPKSTDDAKHWMGSASHFADVCMEVGRLVPELATAIPLASQEKFIRAVRAIKAASGSYNAGLRPNIDNGLEIIVKTLRTELAIEGHGRFSIRALRQCVERLTPIQKQILDATWNYYRSTEKPLPARNIQPVIGKRLLKDVLTGLNGSLIYETQDNNARCLSITLYGVFLTDRGNVVADLLIGALDFVRQLYEKDNAVTTFDSAAFARKLGDDNTKLMYCLMRLQMPHPFPFHYAGGATGGSTWSARIDDEVMTLYQAEDTVAYLDGLLAPRYKEQEPMLYDERLKRDLAANANAFAAARQSWDSGGARQAPKHVVSTFIDASRLDDLRGLEKASFDCTRLIAMCEELNSSVQHENAHAVAMLTRAIVDHVPPVFGFKSFEEVAANYGGTKERSFKKAMERLDKHTKEVANRLLHGQISNSEVAPTMAEVSYPGELNHLLSEVYRRLK
jgi:hypothetical protein